MALHAMPRYEEIRQRPSMTNRVLYVHSRRARYGEVYCEAIVQSDLPYGHQPNQSSSGQTLRRLNLDKH